MLFDPTPSPRLFATPIGVDFCASLIDGLHARLAGQGPEALARVEIHVANARMQRRLQALYIARGPGLLPRIRPVLALSELADLDGLPRSMSPLALRLKLAQLIARMIDSDPSIAPRSALYDLADSLADFMGEMAEESVRPQDIAMLDMGDHSEHWKRAQAFLRIAADVIDADDQPIPEARQALIVDRLLARWRHDPPRHPVIVAGSTGSRRATFRLMKAVAQLPQGAVILPGLDRDLPIPIWDALLEGRRDGLAGEDHPQYRLAKLITEAGLTPERVPDWTDAAPRNPARNRLVSLALRPAPVTDQWLVEGPKLRDVDAALADVTLLEAPSPQIEATAIALRLRAAIEDGKRAALVTPDRALARKVAAQLDLWRIVPDDSAGQVLALTAPGRFLRHVAEAMTGPISAEALIAILKHPLCHSGGDRQAHNLRVLDLELEVLRKRYGFPSLSTLRDWALARERDPGALAWIDWLADTLLQDHDPRPRPLAARVAAHLALGDALAAGVGQSGSGALYDREPGAAAASLVSELVADAAEGGDMGARDYADFFAALAADRDVRFAIRPHADVLIWGTQEARVQGADLTILAGLNEGVWPQAPQADPWLNRPLRAEVALRLPDRVTGLSAHDFQQGIAGAEVWLSRAKRDAETDTVPSRWLNRLTNLLGGASPQSQTALATMKAEGDRWIAMAVALTRPAAALPRAPRPAPAPQNGTHLHELAVTELEKLTRDPYAVYARRILNLRPLDPLRRQPDGRLRGTVLHGVMQRFIDTNRHALPNDPERVFSQTAAEVLQREAPWPAIRRIWQAHLDRLAPWYLAQEAAFRDQGTPHIVEGFATWDVPGLDLSLRGTADRIDLLADGRIAIFDYKTGRVPTDKQLHAFNKQLWLEALMAQGAAWSDEPLEVAHLTYIGLGATPELRAIETDAETLAQVLSGLHTLVRHYRSPEAGFTARRAMQDTGYDGDYDHLARYTEWDETDDPQRIPVGRRDGE